MRKITSLHFAILVAAFTIIAAYQLLTEKTMSATSPEEADGSVSSSNIVTSALPVGRGTSLLPKGEIDADSLEKQQARLEAAFDALVEQARKEDSVQDQSDPMSLENRPDRQLATVDHDASATLLDEPNGAPSPKQNFASLAYYVFSEIPPAEKPADTVLRTMKSVPIGTPVEEIKRASDAFGLDFSFMKAVAKIESGFNPKQRTGSYIGLFQLSNYEFKEYGSGNITDARDNAVAGAYKFATEALLFEFETGKKPTFSDLYLIHQQGWQGAAQHVSHPKRVAWKSMCATDEGKEKGERWCKRAIWGNTLPAIKHLWKSVDKLTSAAFVGMWQQRVDDLYSRYSAVMTKN